MYRPLRRAVCVALLTACTRASPPLEPAVSPIPAPSARASSAPVPPARPHEGTLVAPEPVPAPAGPCLPAEPNASPGVLVEESADALDRDAKDRALSCADEALALAPRHVGALTARGDALAAANRVDEARLAFARALAIDPDAPGALLGAAELHVRRLGGKPEAIEAGLEYAVRGARAAALRKDRELVGRLELVAGMAENDLGRSNLALPHLDRAVHARPEDADAVYERGVALYELCRFDDAQRAFERALALAPDDPWTLHQLGLLAERRGEERRASSLLGRARSLAPTDFKQEPPVDMAAFRAEVETAVAGLPAEERRALQAVPIEIQDLPDAADLLAVHPPLSPSILGLFRGPSENEACTAADGPRCRTIVFYRKNLLRFAADRGELTEQVRVTLLHELGHLHGESDDDLRARGLE
ncbi:MULTISPECIES: metallopeptidase family protein [unclassified Anaeromyxobacter]|uniref:metallopeptidase family protein n=1 Tax=unclassified Anaeromyxobacter TaxID=2620896 RepID=UPI001F55D5B3|nr:MULTISPECIES: metallopeptidase family protein [unclassified Anaeromyxobacter]